MPSIAIHGWLCVGLQIEKERGEEPGRRGDDPCVRLRKKDGVGGRK